MEPKIMTENSPKVKYKHLSKLGNMILQCISCGDCREATDFSSEPPKWGVCVARDHTSGFEPFSGRGKMQIIRSLWQGKLELSKDMAEVIFQCPTCNACSETCYYDLDNATFYEALRAELVEAGYALDGHKEMNQAIINLLNPYEREKKQKNDWLEKLHFKVKGVSSERSDVLYFVGCTTALTPDLQKVAINTAKVLKKLEVDFGVFGRREVCCGSVSLRTGDLMAFNFVKEKNIELFQKSGVKTIITSCAGCYRTLKLDYAELFKDLGIKVFHTIEFISKIINEKSIQLNNLEINATYHDPCHLGRHAGIYDEPRELLKKLVNLTEMPTIKGNSKCCGAGGGVKKCFPELALDIAKSRVQEAEETRAEYLVSACPFCYKNLSDAIRALNSKIEMVDLLELLYQALN